MSSGRGAGEAGAPLEPAAFTEVAPFYDQLMASVPYRFWVSYVEALWQTHGARPRRLLDIACGTGTVSLLFAEKGLDVVGVDLSPQMIDVARRKAAERRVDGGVEFLVADAAAMPPIQPGCDAAICLFDSLNNILERSDLARAMATIRQSLRDDGLFLFDLNTAYAFRQGMFNQRSSPMDEPLRYVWKSRFDEARQICTVTMDFDIQARGSQPGRSFTEVHVQRAYARPDVEEMLREAGFTEIAAYDAYTMNPPKKRSDRIFWAAR